MRKRIASVRAHYAVTMNAPTKNNENKLTYYFSLRRSNENYNARELEQFCMKVTDSKIGGDHPWESGVNLKGDSKMEEFQ